MVYISADGGVKASRSPWRLSIFHDFVWAVINFFGLFFRSLFSNVDELELKKKREGTHNFSRGNGGSGGGPPKPPRGPRRRMGRVGGAGGGGKIPSMPGGGG